MKVAKPAADQRSGAWEQAKAQLQQALSSAQSSLRFVSVASESSGSRHRARIARFRVMGATGATRRLVIR